MGSKSCKEAKNIVVSKMEFRDSLGFLAHLQQDYMEVHIGICNSDSFPNHRSHTQLRSQREI